jgi:creatinine amidohydrolase/Fe(II)-dependent formamide hydrolase-like protein
MNIYKIQPQRRYVFINEHLQNSTTTSVRLYERAFTKFNHNVDTCLLMSIYKIQPQRRYVFINEHLQNSTTTSALVY